MTYELPISTVQQVYDALGWAIETGRAQQPLMLDRRGVGYLQPDKHHTIGLGMPPLDEMFADDAVYLRAVF
jgi:hypothetical protein